MGGKIPSFSMRHIRKVVATAVVVAVALSATAMIQQQLNSLGKMKDSEELLYLPNERLLNHFTAGLHSVVADLLWLKCIQYTVREFHSQDHKFTWLEHICNTIVRLDPYFTGAYQLGGTLLAAIGNDAAAIELVKKGIVRRPDRWELPFELAKTYILNRREDPSSPMLASYYLLWTADLTEGADREFFTRWAYNIQRMHDLSDVGKQIWANIRETSKDPFMRELAERKIHLLNLRTICEGLTVASKRYKERFGRIPNSVQALLEAGLVDEIPDDPLGGTYMISPEGTVLSTSLLDEELQERQRSIRGAINRFRNDTGRYPESLEELVSHGEVKALPKHPYPDRAWRYNPKTGDIE